MTEHFTLTTLQYSEDRRGPWLLYIYGPDGFHSGGQWFARKITHPEEMITVGEARARAAEAVEAKREVRVCDAGDFLVFHSKDGRTLYGEDFWVELELMRIGGTQ